MNKNSGHHQSNDGSAINKFTSTEKVIDLDGQKCGVKSINCKKKKL
jgi:hypothetical protein